MDQRNDAAAAARRKALGAFIRTLRGNRTQTELASQLGNMSQAAISAWENGAVDLTYEQVRDLELALGVHPGTLGLVAGYVDLPLGPVEANPPEPPTKAEGTLLTSAPDLIAFGRHWFYGIDDAVEAVRAADTLDLGVHLWNVRVKDDLDDSDTLKWVVEVAMETVVVSEDD